MSLIDSLKHLGRLIRRAILARPEGETQTFVACRDCLSLGGGQSPSLMCGDCRKRYTEQRTSGWTSLPDWWKTGTPVVVIGEWTDPTEIIRIEGDVAALSHKTPSGVCWPIDRIRPLGIH